MKRRLRKIMGTDDGKRLNLFQETIRSLNKKEAWRISFPSNLLIYIYFNIIDYFLILKLKDFNLRKNTQFILFLSIFTQILAFLSFMIWRLLVAVCWCFLSLVFPYYPWFRFIRLDRLVWIGSDFEAGWDIIDDKCSNIFS